MSVEQDIESELRKQTRNQEKIINLLEKLITMVAASAIAESSTSVNSYDRQHAAQYAQNIFNKNK